MWYPVRWAQRSGVMRGWLITACLVVWQAGGTYAGEIAGNAFSNPALTWQMPPGWELQTVRPEAAAANADLVVVLDQQLHPPLLPLIKAFATEHHLEIAVSAGTCGISAGLLSRKAADVGGFCCPPARSDRLPGLRFYTLGIAAVALITTPRAPVDSLSLQQARSIFGGEVTDWSALANRNSHERPRPIHPIARLHCKLRPGHWRLLLDSEELFSADLLEVGTIQDMVTSVSRDPLAIGYETLWMVRQYANAGRVKTLRLNGFGPTTKRPLPAVAIRSIAFTT